MISLRFNAVCNLCLRLEHLPGHLVLCFNYFRKIKMRFVPLTCSLRTSKTEGKRQQQMWPSDTWPEKLGGWWWFPLRPKGLEENQEFTKQSIQSTQYPFFLPWPADPLPDQCFHHFPPQPVLGRPYAVTVMLTRFHFIWETIRCHCNTYNIPFHLAQKKQGGGRMKRMRHKAKWETQQYSLHCSTLKTTEMCDLPVFWNPRLSGSKLPAKFMHHNLSMNMY